jgi:hypothetical protein
MNHRSQVLECFGEDILGIIRSHSIQIWPGRVNKKRQLYVRQQEVVMAAFSWGVSSVLNRASSNLFQQLLPYRNISQEFPDVPFFQEKP